MTNAPRGTRHCRCAVWCILYLPVTVRVEEDPILTSIILMDAIPMGQCEWLLALDNLSADRTTSCLLLQAWCTQCRGHLPCQQSIALLTVRLAVRGEWIGLAFALHRTLGFDRCLDAEELLARCRIGTAPGCPRWMGNVALGDPASRFVRMAECGPAIESSPDATVEMRTRRTPDAVPRIVGPSSEERMPRSDEWGRGAPAAWRQSALLVAVMACTLALLGVIWRLAGLPLGRTCLRTVCPKKSKPCASGVMIVLWGKSRTPRAAQKA
jgi:hypothetical protein